jgi:pSer/pThr/pTyr-binding forkhead associated (FHA) protein
MPYIQLNDQQFPLKPGEARVGTGPDAQVRLPGADVGSVEAIVELSKDNHAAIRRATDAAVVRVNGVQLGAEPTPLIHGDKIEIRGQELLYGDDRKGGSTQMVSGSDIAALQAQYKSGQPARPTSSTGGRLVSLVDGREYAVPGDGLTLGRDAGCDVVVPSTEVSRKHAEIRASPAGYLLTDTSTNGVFVNGQRIVATQTLGRGDVLRIGNEEFRFYADVAPAVAPAAASSAGTVAASTASPAAPAPVPAAAPPRAAGAPASAAASTPPSAPAMPAKAAAAPAPAPVAAPSASSARELLATLEIVNEGLLKGTRFEVRSPLSHIGRGAHNDIVVTDDSVSDSHAKLQKRADGWHVVDMSSTNGTYVAGRRIQGEAPLGAGADVRFGGVKLAFRPVGALIDDAKGTRAIAGISVEQARKMAGREAARPAPAPAPAPVEPPAGGFPGWVWLAAVVVVGAAAYFILQGR